MFKQKQKLTIYEYSEKLALFINTIRRQEEDVLDYYEKNINLNRLTKQIMKNKKTFEKLKKEAYSLYPMKEVDFLVYERLKQLNPYAYS